MTKNIPIAVILSIVTCGIYAWYWLMCITTEATRANSSEWSTAGGTTVLLCIVTCGLYMHYWNYKMGRAFMSVNGGRDNSILYLILGVLGLQIINLGIMQDDINKMYFI